MLKTLEIAARLSTDTQVRFAVLTHDLGKGVTPPGEWPHHYHHGEQGATLVLKLCERLRIPKAYRDLAVHVARYHNHAHRAEELRPGTILKLLNRLDAFRRPYRFAQFLLACEADARGRTGLENRPYGQADWLRTAFQAAKAVTARPLVAAGFQGEAIAQTLHQQRIKAIKQTLAGRQA